MKNGNSADQMAELMNSQQFKDWMSKKLFNAEDFAQQITEEIEPVKKLGEQAVIKLIIDDFTQNGPITRALERLLLPRWRDGVLDPSNRSL